MWFNSFQYIFTEQLLCASMCWQLGPKRGRSLQELFVYNETVKDRGEVLFQERHRMLPGLARGGTPRRAEGMAREFFRGTDGNLSWGSRESARLGVGLPVC